MSKLAKLKDSNEITFDDIYTRLAHNLNSTGFVKVSTISDLIDKTDVDEQELKDLEKLIIDSKGRYKNQTRELESVESLLVMIRDKIRFHQVRTGVKESVEEVFVQKGRRAGRKSRKGNRKSSFINQSRSQGLPENESRMTASKTEEVKAIAAERVYELMDFPQEEKKHILAIYGYYKKLMSQEYIKKSELMSLKDYFDRASKYLKEHEWIVDYKKMNNLKNRLKAKVNKCGSKIPSSELTEEYHKFIALISKDNGQ